MMSNMGTFLINGSERIVVSQFVRSPGVYFRERPSLNHQKMIHVATIIPNRGSWLEFENDNHNNLLLNVNFLTCKDICIPGNATLQLIVPPGAGQLTRHSLSLEKYISKVPRKNNKISSQ